MMARISSNTSEVFNTLARWKALSHIISERTETTAQPSHILKVQLKRLCRLQNALSVLSPIVQYAPIYSIVITHVIVFDCAKDKNKTFSTLI